MALLAPYVPTEIVHPDADGALPPSSSDGAAGLIGNGPPDGNTASDGTTAEDAVEGTTWLDDDTDVLYVKKADGTWTTGTSV